MSNVPLSHLSLDQLKQAVRLKEQIAELEGRIAAILGGEVPTPSAPSLVPRGVGRPKGSIGKMSPEARERIAEAQRARWAAFRAKSGAARPVRSGGGRGGFRVMSAAAKARIVAAQKARWARFHALHGK
jgi:hypothetical protein